MIGEVILVRVGPPGDGLHMAGCYSEKIPLLTWGILGPQIWGGNPGLVVGEFDCGPTGWRFESASCWSFDFP